MAGLKARLGVFVRLSQRYAAQYQDQAKALATAVGNELFSTAAPEGSPAHSILEQEPDTVARELRELRDSPDLLKMVHLTLSQEIPLRWAYGVNEEADLKAPFDKLAALGLLVPVDEVSTEEFISIADEWNASC